MDKAAKVAPKLISDELVSVKPMEGPRFASSLIVYVGGTKPKVILKVKDWVERRKREQNKTKFVSPGVYAIERDQSRKIHASDIKQDIFIPVR